MLGFWASFGFTLIFASFARICQDLALNLAYFVKVLLLFAVRQKSNKLIK